MTDLTPNKGSIVQGVLDAAADPLMTATDQEIDSYIEANIIADQSVKDDLGRLAKLLRSTMQAVKYMAKQLDE